MSNVINFISGTHPYSTIFQLWIFYQNFVSLSEILWARGLRLRLQLPNFPNALVPFLTPLTLQAALGSHVVMVAQILERISFARTGVINIHIVKAGLIPRLVALSFQYPFMSALQSTCCRIMRWFLVQTNYCWLYTENPSDQRGAEGCVPSLSKYAPSMCQCKRSMAFYSTIHELYTPIKWGSFSN